MKILIVDDSELIHSRLQTLIGNLAFFTNIIVAYDTNEAIELNDTNGPDVVITDLHMPGSGFKLIEHLAKEKDRPTVIVLTNHTSDSYRKRCMQSGADYFFDKSTEFSSLTGVLNRIAVR